MASASESRARGPWCEPWIAGAIGFALYGLLGQSVFYKTDGPHLLAMLHEGRLQHPWQLAWLPLLDGVRRCLAWLGCEPSLLHLGNLFSAAGAAAAVLGFRAGLRTLEVPRHEARIATWLLACNPGVLLFGTVVEFHAPALGAVGLSFWWFAGCVRRPSWWRLAVLGLWTHVAFLMHCTCVFLPALLLPWFVALRWRPGGLRADLGWCLLAGGVHVAAFLLAPRLCPGCYGDYVDLGRALAREASIERPQSIDYVPRIFVQEWLLPLLPASLLVWFAAARRELRREFWAFAIGLAPFLYLSTRQLVFEPEYGAYLLPLLLPAARLAAPLLTSSRWRWPVLAASLLGGVGHVAWHEHALEPAYDRFAAELRDAAAGRPPFVLIGTHEEFAMALARLSPDEFAQVRLQASLPLADFSDAIADATVAGLHGKLREGRAVLVTDGALRELREPAAVLRAEHYRDLLPTDAYAGPRFLALLQTEFRLAPVAPAADAGHGRAVAVWRLLAR